MRDRGKLIAVLAVCVALLAGLVAGCSLGPKVPDVTGKTSQDAVRALQDAGYKLGDVRRIYTPGMPPGTVFAQNPAAGTRLAEGKPVSLEVALPLGEFTVPGVTGKTAEEASSAIAAASLTPQRVDEYSDTVPAGTVSAQIPEAGAKVDVKATVVYVVSNGKAPSSAKVPNVTGKSRSDADKAIKDVGLTPDAEQVYSTSVGKDLVVMQSPAAGTSVPPGSVVSYTYSLGAPTSAVTIPNVVGKSEADAVSALQGAGLVAKVVRQASSSVAKGVVAAQSPVGGEQTVKGGTVAIVVSTGPESLISVPDVVGKSEADAKSALEAAGFAVQTTSQPSADVPKGSVIAQLPVSGSKAPPGSTVVIAVSSGTPPEQ
jgi:serine/threonine-protein kinase